MKFPGHFYKITAACSFGACLGIVVAQFVLNKYPHPSSVEELLKLYTHPLFIGQSWTILIQVFLMFLALWGVAVKAFPFSPALIATGFLFFFFWQVFELIPRSVDLFGISYTLAPQYLEAEPSSKELFLSQIRSLGRLNDSVAEVRRVMWGLGHLLFGLAFWKMGKLEKVMAVIFIGNTVRLAAGMIGRSVGPDFLAAGGVVLFIAFMLPLFVLTGYWLWKGNNRTKIVR